MHARAGRDARRPFYIILQYGNRLQQLVRRKQIGATEFARQKCKRRRRTLGMLARMTSSAHAQSGRETLHQRAVSATRG